MKRLFIVPVLAFLLAFTSLGPVPSLGLAGDVLSVRETSAQTSGQPNVGPSQPAPYIVYSYGPSCLGYLVYVNGQRRNSYWTYVWSNGSTTRAYAWVPQCYPYW